ncbi:MAG: phosphatase PAP2 family protein [Patescibacteria group bacterium]|jgi:membrane-associated phospholipid phosphatase
MIKKLIICSVITALLFVIFSVIVSMNMLDSFDYDFTVHLGRRIPNSIDTLFSYFSLIGSFEITASVLIFALLMTSGLLNSIFIFIIFSGTHGIELLGKMYLHHPGPPFQFFRYDLGFTFPSSYVQTGSSYPSGHSLRAVFLMVIFLMLVQQSSLKSSVKHILSALIIGFVVIMLVSRVSLGEHWVSDVIGGILLGLASSLFSGVFIPTHASHRAQSGGKRILPTHISTSR